MPPLFYQDFPEDGPDEFQSEIPEMNEAPSKSTKPAVHKALRVLEFGRRDWTRTSDPHHVKVML